MSYIVSGLNIKNIFEYNSGNSYSKYDIVDYQFATGASLYPSYTGNGQTGLTSWFNNDLLENFKLNPSFEVTGWNNLVLGSGNLNQTGNLINANPYVDFNENYIQLINNETLSGSGFASPSRTVILLVEAENIKYLTQSQKIFQFGDNPDYGIFRLSGNNSNLNAKLLLDNNIYNAVCPIYDTKNIFTVIQNNSASSIKIRQNGYEVGTYSSFDSNWTETNFIIGNNLQDDKVKYYEIIHFTGALNNAEILQYEKYLYEKYFDNTRLYFAATDIPIGIQYSPLFFTGENYWTQDIDDLFTLSYGSSANFSANLSQLSMGDGYTTNVAQSINTLNSKFNLSYDGLTDKETKCLITYFENSPETSRKSLYEGFKGINLNLFNPYKKNAELYFKNISHSTPYNNINSIKIEAESLYDSCLNYKGMLVELDEVYIRTYTNVIDQLKYNDVFYYNSSSFSDRGYYFYTGENFANTSNIIFFPTTIAPENSPTGDNSWFTKEFYFKGDIDYNIDSNIRLRQNQMKNSTIEYDKDGINYNLLEFNVNFKGRSNSETRALLKFLDDKAGFKTFDYLLPQPYNKNISVYCPEWSHTYNFIDNNDVNIKLIEFKNPFSAVTDFNTNLIFSS